MNEKEFVNQLTDNTKNLFNELSRYFSINVILEIIMEISKYTYIELLSVDKIDSIIQIINKVYCRMQKISDSALYSINEKEQLKKRFVLLNIRSILNFQG